MEEIMERKQTSLSLAERISYHTHNQDQCFSMLALETCNNHQIFEAELFIYELYEQISIGKPHTASLVWSGILTAPGNCCEPEGH